MWIAYLTAMSPIVIAVSIITVFQPPAPTAEATEQAQQQPEEAAEPPSTPPAETPAVQEPVQDGVQEPIQGPEQPKTPEQIAHELVVAAWGEHEWASFKQLAGNESGFQPGRLNKSSLACGIPQALPCSKLYPEMDKQTIRETKVHVGNKWYLANPDAERELKWMVNYIRDRYGSPAKALHFWKVIAPTTDINGDEKADGKHYY